MVCSFLHVTEKLHKRYSLDLLTLQTFLTIGPRQPAEWGLNHTRISKVSSLKKVLSAMFYAGYKSALVRICEEDPTISGRLLIGLNR